MLSVVVDDIDMGITQIIRGDDHLTNTFRQVQLYNAIGTTPPDFAHIPLIHGPDGAKLSKRHGALGIEAYRDMGYLPAALRNYLLRLGWGHGDEEVIPTDKAIEWFDLEGVGRSPSRLDFAKLENLNGIYMRETPDAELLERITPNLETALSRSLVDADRAILLLAMTGLKQRAKTLVELADSALFYLRSGPLPINEAAQKILTGDARALLGRLLAALSGLNDWTEAVLEAEVNRLAEAEGLKLGKVAQPLRAALTGSNVSPGIFEVAAILGRDETLRRIGDAAVAP
jgi:glutamyl-tRNA synthetase